MTQALISLGGNLGNPHETIDAAVRELAAIDQILIERTSACYRTPAIGGSGIQPDFLNAAAMVQTDLSSHRLLAILHQIEARFGRTREQRWDARPLDLDLLLFGDAMIKDDALELPHRRMSFRRFVLEPAAEIAPDMIHPEMGWSLQRLRDHLRDAFPLISIAAPGQAWPADLMSKQTACARIAELDPVEVFRRHRSESGSLSDEAIREEVHMLCVDGQLQKMLEVAVGPWQPGELELQIGKQAAVLVSWSVDATIARISSWLDRPGECDLRQRVETIAKSISQPKLLVRDVAELSLRRQYRPRPVLWIDPSNLEWAAREIDAAALAMATVPVKING